MGKDASIKLTCRRCGKEFVFTRAEQGFYEQQGFTPPRRCRECRSEKQSKPDKLVCSQCGSEIREGVSIYCTSCLENVKLEFDMKTKTLQSAIKEVHTRLEAAHSEKRELEESLCHKEQVLRNLELKVQELSQNLAEMHEFYATMNQWFQPTLNGIEERIRERLQGLEHGQDRINERILQLVERMHELYGNITLIELIKRSLKGYRSQRTHTQST